MEVAAHILIIGASTRAAAQSAVRAGLRPVCADLFADEDLRAVADVLPVERYPHGLPAAVRAVPSCPWMFTGALENHPRILAAVSADRPLWGNPAEVVRRARDPLQVRAALADAGLPALEVRSASAPPPADGSWMLRPLRGAAGRGIHVWDDAAIGAKTLREPHCFQRRAAGMPVSAVFLAAGGAAGLIGVTRQLVGEPWLHAAPFQYCGSVGPLPRSGCPARRQIAQTGDVLAARFRLRGLFGCDFLCDGSTAWLTEINPRYTASVEVFEHAWGVPLLAWHRRACHEGNGEWLRGLAESLERLPPGRLIGKAVVYAPCDIAVPAGADNPFRGLPASDLPRYADIPASGTHIATGRPVCTVFAEAADEEGCIAGLRERVAELLGRIWPK